MAGLSSQDVEECLREAVAQQLISNGRNPGIASDTHCCVRPSNSTCYPGNAAMSTLPTRGPCPPRMDRMAPAARPGRLSLPTTGSKQAIMSEP